MVKTIRLARGLRTTGIVCLLLFLSVGIGSVVGILQEPPPNARVQPIYLAIGFGCFWAGMSSLAVWLMLMYWRGRAVVTDEGVTVKGVIRARFVSFGEVTRIVWKSAPAQIRLHTENSRVRFDLTNFESTDRLWLVRRMKAFSGPVHEGWDDFCLKVAVPLQQNEIRSAQEIAPGQVTLTRTRWANYFLPATFLFAIVGLLLCWTLGQPRMLVAPLPLLLLWAFLHFNTPQKGLVSPPISAAPGQARFLTFAVVWGGVGIAGNIFLTALKLPIPQMIAWGAGGLLLWFAVLIHQALKLDRRRQQDEKTRIPAALLAWHENNALEDPSADA